MEEALSPAPHAEQTEGADQVLLALVDLAREQASELSRQNDQLRRQNEELQRANRHKNEFLTAMSHELRTPLNAILGFSELLQEEIAGPLSAGQADYVQEIHRAGGNLLTLINDLLDLAKIEAGGMDIRSELLDAVVPVADAVDLVRAIALRKEQSLTLEAAGPIACLGDTQRIRQVAINLLANAAKFTPRGGSVAATVRAVDDAVEIEVRDSGIGIDPANHALIFEAFRQVHSGETRDYQGTGLGLALVGRFCAAMGGSVGLTSAPGEGATFRVRLRPPPPRNPGGPPLIGLLRASSGEDPTSALVAHGFDVEVLGPPEAFALRDETCAVVVDAAESGVAQRVARRLRVLRPGRVVPVLALLRTAADPGAGPDVETFHAESAVPADLLARLETLARALPGSSP